MIVSYFKPAEGILFKIIFFFYRLVMPHMEEHHARPQRFPFRIGSRGGDVAAEARLCPNHDLRRHEARLSRATRMPCLLRGHGIRPRDHLCPWTRQQPSDLVAAGPALLRSLYLRNLFSSRLSARERDWRSGPEGVRQRSCRLVKIGDYIYSVPYVEDNERIFFKTIIPNSRAA